MPSRDDDPYSDDPYGERREGPDDDARPGRRHATRPARPAWDAMTYGRPDDTRRPVRRQAPEPEPAEPEPAATWPFGATEPSGSEPSYGSSYGPDSYASEPSYGSGSSYGSDTSYGSSRYQTDAPASTPASAYPAASDAYPPSDSYTSYPPATTYPGATAASPSPTADSYAPDAHTSYGASAPPAPGTDEQPVYVAAGLYLDDVPGATGAAPDRAGGAAGAYPGGLDGAAPAAPTGRAPRGGRNVPAAIGVGLTLGAVVLTTLFAWRPAFLGVVMLAVGVAIWELARALRGTGVNAPVVPLLVGGVVMVGLAWWGGTDGLTFGLVITVLAAMVWRLAEGASGYGRDVSAATLVAVYVPFFGGFAAMLASPDDGDLRVLALLIAVVLSDTGGYVVGAKFGSHPMAPSVSPKKSWEGLVGSLAAAALGSAVVIPVMFGAGPWWGLLFGLAIAIVSVIGDLGESMLKRDLGVKDMSGLLPGHGGVMDRLDSILLAAPAGYLMLAAIVPVAG